MMTDNARAGVVAVLLGAMTITLTAQQRGLKTGNPTPGTLQPESPNLADRITLTGCVEIATDSSRGRGATATARDPNAPSDSRFVLTKAERKSVVPPNTGTSPLAGAPASSTYRLHALDSQLSAFTGTKVEVSGELDPLTVNTDGRPGAKGPTLRVEFVQKLAPTCQ